MRLIGIICMWALATSCLAAAPQDQPQPKPDIEIGDKPDPTLIVPPVDEPEAPLDVQAAEKLGYMAIAIPNSGGVILERKGADGELERKVVVRGRILVTRGIVELFGCGEGGKEHETVMRLECDIQCLDMALVVAGLQRGRLPVKLDIDEPGQGSRVLALVQWTDKDGKLVTHRSEDLVLSLGEKMPMPRVGWTYVGSMITVESPQEGGRRKDKILASATSRSLVTTYRDVSSLLDNPLPDAIDDTLFSANYMLLPRTGTPVRVIFRVPTKKEREELAAVEKTLRK